MNSQPTSASPNADHDIPKLSTKASVSIFGAMMLTLTAIGAAVAAFGVLPRLRADEHLRRDVAGRADDRPRVTFVTAVAGAATQTLTLPARMEARREVSLFPRESGYIEKLNADLGDSVTEGAILSVLSTPVLDGQLHVADAAITVAEARLAQVTAQAEQSKATLARYTSAGDSGAVSAETIDQAHATAAVDAAAVAMAKASVISTHAERDRLAEQKRQATITAPFSGEITQRSFDVGSLVVADKTDNTRPLFRITDRDEIRLFVDLPQSAAMLVRTGQEVRVSIRELGGRMFTGHITRASASLDSTTRTRLIEARIDNKDHTLLPGMFAAALIDLPRDTPPVLLPGETIMTRAGKPQIAVIDSANKLHYRGINILRDTGSVVELSSGVASGEHVVINMTLQLDEGTIVDSVDRAAAASVKSP